MPEFVPPETIVDRRRSTIVEMLNVAMDQMNEIIEGRMSEKNDKISAANALSELARTWEGITRGSEKRDSAMSKRLLTMPPMPLMPPMPDGPIEKGPDTDVRKSCPD